MLLNNHLLREKGSKYNAVQKTRNSLVNNVGYDTVMPADNYAKLPHESVILFLFQKIDLSN